MDRIDVVALPAGSLLLPLVCGLLGFVVMLWAGHLGAGRPGGEERGHVERYSARRPDVARVAGRRQLMRRGNALRP